MLTSILTRCCPAALTHLSSASTHIAELTKMRKQIAQVMKLGQLLSLPAMLFLNPALLMI
jgi:hypothetical protein